MYRIAAMKKKNIDVQSGADAPQAADAPPGKYSPPITDTHRAARVGMADQFLSSLSLVCRLPLPFSFTFSAARLDFYLPITALFQAVLFFLGFAAASWIFRDPALAVLSALILHYGAFNLFHFDGLLDTADAFLGTFDRDKRFQILKDPRLGVYGIFTAIIYLGLKFLTLNGIMSFLVPALPGRGSRGFGFLPSPACFLLLLFPLAGKTSAALIPSFYKPAKQEGLGTLAAGSRLCYTLLGFLTALVLYIPCPLLLFIISTSEPNLPLGLSVPGENFWQSPAFFRPQLWVFVQYFLWAVLLALLSALISSLVIGRLYKKGLGGYTGDSLGAATELGELLYLIGFYVWLQHSSLSYI